MKKNYIILSILAFISIYLSAQHNLTIPVELKWEGIKRAYADTLYVEIVSFKEAQYSDGNIPYYNHKVQVSDGFSYLPEILNPVYIEVPAKEALLLEGQTFGETPEVSTYISDYRGEKTLNTQVSPFIKRGNTLLKLVNFELVLTDIPVTTSTNTYTYATSSVLSQGRFVKMRIQESGVYMITYADLKGKGIDPAEVRVFGYGGNVLEEDFKNSESRYDDLPQIPIYDSGSYILFYGEGITKWTYDKTKQTFVHKANSYSNYGYYFITSSPIGEKKRIQEKASVPVSGTTQSIYHFTDRQVYEKDAVSLAQSGKEFYGTDMKPSTTQNISFNFPDIDTNKALKVKISVAAQSSRSSSFTLSHNNQSKTVTVSALSGGSGAKNLAQIASQESTINPSGSNIAFTLKYNADVSAGGSGYLNYIEVIAERNLTMNGNYMIFHNTDNIGSNNSNRYYLSGTNSNTQIWDITDPVNVEKFQVNTESNSLNFVDNSTEQKSYIAVNSTASTGFLKGELLDEVPTQNIHGMEPVDMLIITHPSFLTQARQLADAHLEHTGLNVGVVTTEEVYNEFSSGKPDATAYRWAAKMFYDKPENKNDKLKYLLLFGSGSYDNRGIIPSSGNPLLLTYQSENSIHETSSYVTDDYFGLLGSDEGGNIAAGSIDIGIGRFPVVTTTQARDVVAKTISYMKNEDKGGWKNQVCFVGDDGGKGDNINHMKHANQMADDIKNSHPAYQVNKIMLDAYKQVITASGESYPDAANRLHNLIRSGLFFLNYMGHAGYNVWTSESILTNSDIKAFTNKHLPLVTTGSCNFSLFDQQKVSGGEEFLLNASGGAMGTIAAARTVYRDSNEILMSHLCDLLFNGDDREYISIGMALAKAKNNTGNQINKLSYVYFGDPSLKLNYPTGYNVEVTHVNSKSIQEQLPDTLSALSKISVQGAVTDQNGNIVTDFNGNVHVVVMDKEQEITTLDNHNEDKTMTFKDRQHTLFSGKSEVKNGVFSFIFMVPKDIKYNYGKGRFSFYVWDDTREGHGYYEDIVVGGSCGEDIEDETGPDITMYLNHKGFTSGEKVNETPLFVAQLYDENGINTSGAGIGSDMVLTISQDGKDVYRFTLNDYYESEVNSYQQGVVNFLLPEIPAGKYTLTFKASDLLNNMTQQSLDFEVVKGLTPKLFKVINYPNPAVDHTNIQVEHNRESDIIDMTVDIFDMSGKRVWTFNQKSDEIITWNLNGSNGSKIRPGIYIYRVSIQTKDKITSFKSNKIIVTKQ